MCIRDSVHPVRHRSSFDDVADLVIDRENAAGAPRA